MEVLRLGVESKLQLQLTPQLIAMPDPQSTERGQELKPTSSWILVEFVSAVPKWELP